MGGVCSGLGGRWNDRDREGRQFLQGIWLCGEREELEKDVEVRKGFCSVVFFPCKKKLE